MNDDTKKVGPTPIRISEETKDWLKARARENYRTLSSEIASRLEASIRMEKANAHVTT
jgi:hypothetical protein